MIKEVLASVYKKLGNIIDIMIIILGGYVIYVGEIKYEMLIRSIIILILIIIYWNIANFIGKIDTRTTAADMLKDLERVIKDKEEGIVREKSQKAKNQNRITEIFFYIGDWLMYREEWVRDMVYFSWYCLPWMWGYVIIRWIIKMSIYVRVWINGNKDIIMKRWGIDSTEWFAEVHKTVWYKVWKRVVIYPILRMGIYANYMRSKILCKQWYDLLRIRFVGYFYITFLLYNGYGEITRYVYGHKIVLLMVIYIYFALILPMIWTWRNESESVIYTDYSYWVWLGSRKSITLSLYVELVCSPLGYYYENKYGQNFTQTELLDTLFGSIHQKEYYVNENNKWANSCPKWRKEKKIYEEETYEKMSINKGLWLFEKNYGFSALIYNKIRFYWTEEEMIEQDQIWEEGKARYGVEYMEREYGRAYIEILEFHKCYLLAEFEYERLGVTGEGWKSRIPTKVMGLKMYKDTLEMINFFYGVRMSPHRWGLWVKEFTYSYDIVSHWVESEEEEEYIKKLEVHKKENEGKTMPLIEKMEIDTPFFLMYAYDDSYIYRHIEESNKNLREKGYVHIKEYNFEYIKTEYKEKIRREYNEEVKKLKNWYSVEIVVKEINAYKIRYKERKNVYYER